MRLGLPALLLLMPLLGGCSWVGYSLQNVWAAPVDWFEECKFRHEMRQLAREGWRQVEHADGGPYSPAYAHGFKCGFVDFVESNGTGEPPAMPPYHLQRDGYRTPDAQQEIEDWNAGFRRGASAARASGLRDRFVVPIALPPRPDAGELAREEAATQRPAFPPTPTPTPFPVLNDNPNKR